MWAGSFFVSLLFFSQLKVKRSAYQHEKNSWQWSNKKLFVCSCDINTLFIDFQFKISDYVYVMDTNTKRKLIADVRKLSNGVYPSRPVYQHGHFCVRAFHLILSYPGYSLFLCFLIYLQMMDLKLYFKIRSRESLDFTTTKTSTNKTNSIHIFDPLPVKKIMVEPIVSNVDL